MQFKQLIYPKQNYAPFEFDKNLNKVSYEVFDSLGEVFVNNGLFFVTGSQLKLKEIIGYAEGGLYYLSSCSYQKLNDPVLAKNKIYLCRVQGVAPIPQEINYKPYYLQAIIYEQVMWLSEIFKIIKFHLESRVSSGRRLICYGTTQKSFSEAIIELNLLKNLKIDQTADGNSMFAVAANLSSQICFHLARLVGGRSFLGGNIHEMQWLFNLINTIMR